MPIPNPTYPKARARRKPPMALALPTRPAPAKGLLPAKPAPAKPAITTSGTAAAAAAARPVFGTAPHSVQGDVIRNDAQSAMAGATSNWHDSVFRAVMGIGDPTLIAKYKADPAFAGYNFVADPYSTFGQLDTQQQRGMQDIMGNAVRGNTAMSGLRLNDENKLSSDILGQKHDASQTFEQALLDYAKTLAAAQGDYNTAGYNASQADIDTWNQLHPQPTAGAAATTAANTTTTAQRAAQAQAQANAAHAAAVARAQHDAAVAAAKKAAAAAAAKKKAKKR